MDAYMPLWIKEDIWKWLREIMKKFDFFAYCCSVIDTDVDRVVQWSGKALRLMGSVFGDYRSMCP